MSAVAGRKNLDPDKIYHYVPGEICIVASAAAGNRYEEIQQMLNGEITRLLPLAGSGVVPGNSPEDQILGPTAGVWGDLHVAPADDAGGQVLFRQPVRKTAQRSAPLQQDGGIIALHFFRVALAPPKSLVTMRQYRSVVRELVNLIHKVFIDVPAGQETRNGITFHAVSPNWLSSFAGCGGNSPGTPSAPVRPDAVIANNDYARFHFWDEGKGFGNSALEMIVATQRETPPQVMTVAVLDTCPPPGQVGAAPNTRLLQEMTGGSNPVKIEAPPSLDATGDFQEVVPFLPNYLGALQAWFQLVGTNNDQALTGMKEKYGAPDHGLFVAGIIRDIAPGASVRLIRVLDDAGVGDLLGIAWVLSVLASGAPRRGFIINLSLTVDIPTDVELRDFWIKDSGWTSTIPAEVEARLGRILANVVVCIDTLFAHLREREILVVAAAGNDANGPAGRPVACLPARNPNVFSVSSVNRDPASADGGPSLFSNNSDGEHGIATLSGDGDLTTVPNTMLMESPLGQITDGTQGVFSGAFMTSNKTGNPMGDKDPNLSGWVWWAGTSFSTPIITALAAVIQADQKAKGNAILDPAGLIKEVKSYGDPKQPGGDLNCRIIYTYQKSV
jgi:hypothetical protein